MFGTPRSELFSLWCGYRSPGSGLDGGSRGLTHREPLIDEKDFERFIATMEPLLQPRRDVMWVLAGRTKSNIPKLEKILPARKILTYNELLKM